MIAKIQLSDGDIRCDVAQEDIPELIRHLRWLLLSLERRGMVPQIEIVTDGDVAAFSRMNPQR